MTNVWTQDLTLEFIQLYKDESILWDRKHSYHKHKHDIREAWNRIQANLSVTLPVEDLKRKKESLMTSFRARIRKKKKNRGKYRPQWFAFQLMYSFLGNLEQFELEYLNSSQDTDHDYLGDEDRKPSTTPTDKQYVVFTSRTPNLKRQYVNTSYESARTFDQSKTDEAASAEGMDECELYAHLLAKKLRKLDEDHRDMAMHAIDNIMFQAKNNTRNKLAKRRQTKSPMYIFSQDNEVLKCYDESDRMEDGIEIVETLSECDNDDDD